jgi:hypothetical protein
MSQTIAHRHATHVHIPLAPIIALVIAVIVAAAVLILINQPTTTNTRTETTASAATAVVPAVVPHHETLAMHRHIIEQAQARAKAPGMSPAERRILHNHLQGTSVGALSSGAAVLPAVSTGVTVQHTLDRFPGRFPGPR